MTKYNLHITLDHTHGPYTVNKYEPDQSAERSHPHITLRRSIVVYRQIILFVLKLAGRQPTRTVRKS